MELDGRRLIEPARYAEHGYPHDELVTRIESVEFSGTPERTASNLVPGFKHMPIHYRIRPATC
jgi:hypothetical protein